MNSTDWKAEREATDDLPPYYRPTAMRVPFCLQRLHRFSGLAVRCLVSHLDGLPGSAPCLEHSDYLLLCVSAFNRALLMPRYPKGTLRATGLVVGGSVIGEFDGEYRLAPTEEHFEEWDH